MSRRTVAVIVTYNRLDALKTTVGNTLAQDFHAVVVVNNLSTDGTKEWLDAQQDPRLEVIHSGANLGGAGGFHLGFDHAARKVSGADWLVAFDDDAHPEPGMLDAFNNLEIPEEVGSLAAAVYMPNGTISEMNRPSVNPFWHFKELIATAFRGRHGFHVSDDDYKLKTYREIDASSFVGFFLRISLIREGKIGLPRSELFIYSDDIIYVLELRKTGAEHWFVPWLKFSHDCETLLNQKDVYRPLWKCYFTYRNRIEMYRVASGIFYPLVLAVKIPKIFFTFRYYAKEERLPFLKISRKAIWHGITKNYSMSFNEVVELSQKLTRR